MKKKQIERDAKGRITKGIAQDTNKNGTAGRPCEYCKDKERINKIAQDYLQSTRDARKKGKPFIPYLQELADMLDCDSDRIGIWADKLINEKDSDSFEHPEFRGTIKGLKNLQALLLLQRTTGRFSPIGAIFQLKTNHGYIETEKRLLAGDPNNPVKSVHEFVLVEAKINDD